MFLKLGYLKYMLHSFTFFYNMIFDFLANRCQRFHIVLKVFVQAKTQDLVDLIRYSPDLLMMYRFNCKTFKIFVLNFNFYSNFIFIVFAEKWFNQQVKSRLMIMLRLFYFVIDIVY